MGKCVGSRHVPRPGQDVIEKAQHRKKKDHSPDFHPTLWVWDHGKPGYSTQPATSEVALVGPQRLCMQCGLFLSTGLGSRVQILVDNPCYGGSVIMGFTVLTDWRLTVQYCPGPGMALLLGPLCYACGQGDVRGLTLGRWLVLWSSLCVAVHGYEDGADGYQQLCFGGGGDGVGVGVCVLSSAFKVVQGLLTFGLFWVSGRLCFCLLVAGSWSFGN